ncbi:MAG TPA: glycosyltransferase [Flavitalea sp.]|nr:glycosyltransferase [Flavitalea sp.]
MKILLVTHSQFGLLVDYHRYYTYLKSKGHEVKYLCYDFNKERIEPGNPDIIYVPRKKNKVFNHLRFIRAVAACNKEHDFDRVMIHVFPLVSLLLLWLDRGKAYLDIRTVSIHKKKYKRAFFDFLILIASTLYKHVSVIADSAAKQIGIRKYKLLPLGGAYFGDDPISREDQERFGPIVQTDDYVFLYVGALRRRNIIECVRGFHQYLQKNPGSAVRFIVVGSSPGNELEEINQYIQKHQLQAFVYTTGFIPQNRLAIFFKHANCGVSFTPMVMPYPLQPNTKTYEYLVNGMPFIANPSLDNVRIMDSAPMPVGVIVEDSAAGMEEAFGTILRSKELYKKEEIRKEYSRYEWDNLFKIYLEQALSLNGQ